MQSERFGKFKVAMDSGDALLAKEIAGENWLDLADAYLADMDRRAEAAVTAYENKRTDEGSPAFVNRRREIDQEPKGIWG